MPDVRAAWIVSLLGLGLPACGAHIGDGGTVDGGEPIVDAVGGDCDRQGFVAAVQSAHRDDDESFFSSRAATGEDAPIDIIAIEYWFELGATDGPHTVALTGENYVGCAHCVLVKAGCAASCDTTFLAQAGTLEVTAMGGIGSTYVATLTDLRAAEVTIDGDTLESTVVVGGQTWCVDRVSLEAVID